MDNFLNKLYNTDLKLSLLLLEAKKIAEQHEDTTELSNYIDNEIDGYKGTGGLPEYRKIKGKIVCDIQDVFGNLTHEKYAVDFSILSEKVGFDLDDAHIPDGISFIEASLGGIEGKTAVKPIPKQLVKMLDETFHFNNRQLHIVAAYHRVNTSSLSYILAVVRQNLILKFQSLNKKIQDKKNEIILEKSIDENESNIRQKKVFVSYAWESDDHNTKVISFVNFLRLNGFDASMDKKSSQEESATNFNKMMIDGIQNSEKVIIVLSKKYKEKADEFTGGVWQELNMIIEDLRKQKNKYIFVFFGNDNRSNITPTAIAGLEILDLKEDQDKNSFNSLFAKIKEENIIEFGEVNKTEVIVKKIEIKPFKL